MFIINVKSVSMFMLISAAWWFGFAQLGYSIEHFSTEWPWVLGSMILAAMVNEWFLHNILSHRRFEVDTSRWAYKILTFLATTEGLGNPRSFVLLHKAHHKWADVPGQDILYPPAHWFAGCTGSPFAWIYRSQVKFPDELRYFAAERKKFENILNDSWTRFCEQYVVLLTIIFWGLLYLVVPVILFKVIFLSRAILTIYRIFLDVFGHYKLAGGYRNFNLRDNSYNNIVSHYLALGLVSSLLHNNHHGFPDGPKGLCLQTKRWFEFDLGYYGIRMLKIFLEKK